MLSPNLKKNTAPLSQRDQNAYAFFFGTGDLIRNNNTVNNLGFNFFGSNNQLKSSDTIVERASQIKSPTSDNRFKTTKIKLEKIHDKGQPSSQMKIDSQKNIKQNDEN